MRDEVTKTVLGSEIAAFRIFIPSSIFQHHDQFCHKEPQHSALLNVEAILKILQFLLNVI